MRTSMSQLFELARFYQAAALNAAFGFGCYALLVWFGLNIYVAQILSHLCGMAFNYVTYSNHVFRDATPAKARFLGVYALNYVVSLLVLAGVSRVIPSPYLAGFLALVIVSVGNYVALKHFVFVKKPVE